MSKVDMLRREIVRLEAALPDVRDYVEAKREIAYLEEDLECEEETLWLKLTLRERSPA